MKIKFRDTRRKTAKDVLEKRTGNTPRLAQADDAIREGDSGGLKCRDGRMAEALENPWDKCWRTGLTNETDKTKTELARDGKGKSQNYRVQMQMRVAIPVGGRKSQSEEALELPSDFRCQIST